MLATGTPGGTALREPDAELSRRPSWRSCPRKGARAHARSSSRRASSRRSELAIEAQGLTRRFGDFTAVDHVSFHIERGEIFGFLGSNGCGKTDHHEDADGAAAYYRGERDAVWQLLEAGRPGNTQSRRLHVAGLLSLWRVDRQAEPDTARASVSLAAGASKPRVDELVSEFGWSRISTTCPTPCHWESANGFRWQSPLSTAGNADPR